MQAKQKQLKILTAKKEQYFIRIQNLYDSSKDLTTPEKINQFRVRYETMEETKNLLLEMIDEINELECDINPDYVPNYAILNVVNDMRCHIICVEKGLNNPTQGTSQQSGTSSQSTSKSVPKLPKLSLPKFTGDIKEWPLFIECFNSMIHNNTELSNVDKIHYLIGCLTGSALNVCSGIPPTGENYNIILQALIDKFEDKRILANSYLEQIFNFKPTSVESYSTLNTFLEKFDSAVTALLKLNLPDLADYILAYLALAKLNPETQRLFENNRRNSEMPSYDDIKTFVKEQAKICSRTGGISTGNYSKNHSMGNYSKNISAGGYNKNTSTSYNKNISTGGNSKFTHSFVVQGSNLNSKCSLCKNDNHYLGSCSNFLKMSPEERYRHVRNNNLCLNCLSPHKVINCRNQNTCRSCHAKHHTLLHFKPSVASASTSGDNMNSKVVDSPALSINDNLKLLPTTSILDNIGVDNSKTSSNPRDQPIVNFCLVNNSYVQPLSKTILLSTAKVNVLDKNGFLHEFKFLIDSCSQGNFLSLESIRRLKLNMTKIQSEVRGIGSSCNNVRGISSIVVVSQAHPFIRYPIDVFVVDKITEPLPHTKIDIKNLHHLNNLKLADNDFHRPSKIDGIIGASLFPHLLGQRRVAGQPETPVAIETTLGFVVMGEAPVLRINNITHNFCSVIVEPSLESLVKKFWEVEDITSPLPINPDDEECEKLFHSSHSRDNTGRYTVSLPFKFDPSLLGDSYQIALKRFFSLEKKLLSDLTLKEQYCDIILDYLSQGHMVKLIEEPSSKESYYIPHHVVFKSDSTSTPTRIVFDGSCKTDSNYSLNDLLFAGPKLQSDVCSMFLNFRLFGVAITADIRQMYRQIKLHKDHHRYHRILWRFCPSDPIDTYELTTVSFGIKSSPFLAMRTVLQLAHDEKPSLPLASDFISRDMYVDDFVSSVHSTSLAIQLYHETVEMFRRGGFDIVKWATNSKDLLSHIAVDNRSNQIVSFEFDRLKVLGLQWQPSSDVLSFSFDIPQGECSKRHILSTVARCYDPLGFLAPVTLLAKILIKQLWILKIGWDELPPPDIVRKWDQFKRDLPLLSTFDIPRHIGIESGSAVILVGFCDACISSFGAVVYSRSISSSGNVNVSLLCAKAKVSPMKIVTIPRLELCAAHLLAKLLKFVVESYQSKLKIARLYALSDSTVTLNWISTHASSLTTFIANRVVQIQSWIGSDCWFHIDGRNNISDCLSRGLSPSQFISNSSWKNGPDWLKWPPSSWPISRVVDKPIPEPPLLSVVVTKGEDNPFLDLIMRKSKWLSLLRSVVYILRFLKLLPKSSFISNTDLDKAEIILIKVVQYRHFKSEILLMEKNLSPPSLKTLRPFLHDGIIRVGGRLSNSELSFENCHPILLPKKDRFVDLLIDYFHYSNFHTGPSLVLALLRLRYWILSGRGVVRYRIQKCNICFRLRPKPQIPLMGNLPTCRVQGTKPFLQTGCDYAGPVQIIPYLKRGVRAVKAYICLFICLATKALHLELVTDLSTSNFLQAFKRFISRRGLVSVFYTDNGTNFIGAKSALNSLYSLVNSKEYNTIMGGECATLGIAWKLNPPSAPHFGGIWESNVKSVKTHIYKIVGNQLLTYEEFNTLLVQIEALLNSRPLCVLSSDPSEPIALTPAHFLTLTPLCRLPAENLLEVNINRLNRFRLIDHMVQHFWKRWRLEYLTSLQTRQRWNSDSLPVKIGTVVILEQPHTPPLQWPLGVIEKTYSGNDNIIRVVDVRTKTGIYKRPVVKLCPLPTQ